MRVFVFTIASICGLFFASSAQVQDTVHITDLDEVVFSANKFSERKRNVAQRIDIISSQQITRFNTQNTGDLLQNTGNIFVQKSQQGGSSPVIRGFEASRVLLVVDGVRLNNAIYRSGHLQNVITIDQNMLERVEVLFGPSSTLFGSDALGGVMHFRSRQPTLSNEGTKINGNAFARYSSANNEMTIHADVNIGLKKWGFLTSATVTDFDDMRMGNEYLSKYPDFGRRSFYVERINEKDSVVRNNDDRVQKFSGYRQYDIMQKILYQQSDEISHSVNLQLSGSNDVPRYDRLQDVANGNLRYAEWYYGPQIRSLASYEYLHTKIAGFLNEVRFNLNYQHIEESRHQRSLNSNNRDNRMEEVNVIGFNLDGRKVGEKHELNLGIDGQLNKVNSTAYRKQIVTGEQSKLDTRYPDGDNIMNYLGIYGQHIYKIIPEKLILNDGIRLQLVSLHSTIVDTATQLHLPYTHIEQENIAVTGNLGLAYFPATKTKLSLVVASGFRNPNIDDLSKIFESNPSNKQLVVPNPDLKPEYTYNIDLSLEHRFADELRFALNGYYTWFRNAIVVAPYQLNGEDSIIYNGVKSAVLASQNRNKAYLYGIGASVSGKIARNLEYIGTVNFTEGRFKTDQSELSSVYEQQEDGSYKRVQSYVSSKPLDHIPPVYGRFSVLYSKTRWNLEAYTLFNGWKKIEEYNADGEDNAQYATPDGMPSWYTLNLRSELSITSKLLIQAGVENILDRNYRAFASGFSAAGRNLWVSVRASF